MSLNTMFAQATEVIVVKLNHILKLIAGTMLLAGCHAAWNPWAKEITRLLVTPGPSVRLTSSTLLNATSFYESASQIVERYSFIDSPEDQWCRSSRVREYTVVIDRRHKIRIRIVGTLNLLIFTPCGERRMGESQRHFIDEIEAKLKSQFPRASFVRETYFYDETMPTLARMNLTDENRQASIKGCMSDEFYEA